MIYRLLDFCSSVARRLGVMRLVRPLVRSVEKSMLGRLGSYEAVAIAPDQTRLTASSGIELVMGPSAEFAHLACLVYERPMLTAVLNGLGPIARNAVAWDIGANAGFYSSALARLTLPNGQVCCFEPVLATCRLLMESLLVAGAGNATAHAIALSDHDGEADMASRDGQNTTRSLEAQGSDAVRVVTARADTLVGNARFPSPT
jgi:FkbM family methyltransferase